MTNRLQVVTGYIPIEGHINVPGEPRPEPWYKERGKLFDQLVFPVTFYEQNYTDWVWFKKLADLYPGAQVAQADNPLKNTVEYHAVQHQKNQWLFDADAHGEVLVWLDYGIAHQPNVTAEVINDFLCRVAENEIDAVTMPGCLPAEKRSPLYPNWRFCGSTVICPANLAGPFFEATLQVAADRLFFDNQVTWEVNDWADAELRGDVPFAWYPGDHNSTQFTNYTGTTT